LGERGEGSKEVCIVIYIWVSMGGKFREEEAVGLGVLGEQLHGAEFAVETGSFFNEIGRLQHSVLGPHCLDNIHSSEVEEVTACLF
jgi:hypothetical protein